MAKPIDPYSAQRLAISAQAQDAANLIRAAHIRGIEEAVVRKDHERRARLFAAFQRDLDAAMRPFVAALAQLPPPPIMVKEGKAVRG